MKFGVGEFKRCRCVVEQLSEVLFDDVPMSLGRVLAWD